MASEDDQWMLAQNERTGRPIIHRYRMPGPKSSARFRDGQAIMITWEYDPDERNGMPPVAESERQRAFEDALEPLEDDTNCMLMQVTTGNGAKEWFYIVRSAEAWMQAFNHALADHEPYPLQIEIFDDAWGSWADLGGTTSS